MDSTAPDRDDDTLERTDELLRIAAQTRSPRIATGTVAPPIPDDELLESLDDELETLRALASEHREARAWDELAKTLRRIIDAGQLQDLIGEQEELELYAELGQLEASVLGDVEAAIDAWRKVTAIDPSDLRALAALEDLLSRDGRWRESVEVIERRALVVDDEAVQREALLEAAAIWEDRLADSSRAAELYARVRGLDPTDRVAAERLAAIYAQERRWAELVEILLEQSESLGDAEPQIQLLLRVAGIYERELDDQDSAFYVVQAAFNRGYAHERAGAELERLATATGHWQDVLDEYSGRVAELEREDRRAAADLWARMGRWYCEHLSQLDYAAHSIQQALRIDPTHAGALAANANVQRMRGSSSEQTQDVRGAIDAYEQALAHDPTSATSLEALDRLYRRAEAWQPLVEILTRRAKLATDDADATGFWLEIGSTHELHLADPGQAITAYQNVLALEPSNGVAMRALETLYEKTEQNDQYLAILDTRLAAATADSERIAIYERIATAWEERFGKLDRAAQAYERILAIDPRNTAAHHLLARMHQQAGRYDLLVVAYRNHVAVTADVEARIELILAMAQIHDGRLHDLAGAIHAYEDVLALDADHAIALDALGRLYEKTADWQRAVAALARLAELTDQARKPGLYWRVARIQYSEIGDNDQAEAHLLRALAVDPGHVPALELLTEHYADRGDWQKAAQTMERAASHSALAIDTVRLLNDAAGIYQHKLHQDPQATRLYAAVIALDPEHVAAGRALAGLYFAAGEWAALFPVIEMLCRKLGQQRGEASELHELYFRAARCAEELGKDDKALAYYTAAYELDAAHVPTLMGRADLSFKMQDWASARSLYQNILARRRGSRDVADLVIYYRLGMARNALGERNPALAMFDKALDIDPDHKETLLAVVDLQGKRGDWDAVVRAKRGLLASATGRDKTVLLDDIAAIYNDQLRNAPKATAAYLEALDNAPDDRQLLQKVLDLCTETKQWHKAVDTIQRFVALESDPFRKALYFHAAATLCRDELKALPEAIDYFDCALDSFFAQPERLDEHQLARALRSFEAIDAVLTTTRDWKGQERAYRDMLKRLPNGVNPLFHKLQVGLLDALGEIYRSRLKQYAAATEVFELAQQMDPKSELRAGTDRAEILAELYLVAGPDRADKAIEQHMVMLHREPFKYDSYQALAKIYAETGQWDKHWCLCNTLAFLRKADADQLAFYEQYRPHGLVKAKAAMTADSWARLAHRDENRYISAIFGACWEGVAALKAFPHKDFGVKREDRRQLDGDPLTFSRLFVYAGQVMNTRLPDVYLVDDGKAVDIQLANAIDKTELCPSFVVRPNVLQGKNEREVAFAAARRLAFMRPEYYLRLLLPTNGELKVVLLAAIAMVQPGFPVPPAFAPAVAEYVAALRKRMPTYGLEQLGVLVQRFVQTSPETDIARWSHAVEFASHRAGFVVCGNLELTARAIAAEPPVVGAPTAKDKIRELVLFSASDQLFAIRAQMGLTIG